MIAEWHHRPRQEGKAGAASWTCYPDAGIKGCLIARNSISQACLRDTNKWTNVVDIVNKMFSIPDDSMSLQTFQATSEEI